MQTENPMIADFVKVLNSAAGTLAGLGREAGETAREKAREVFGGFDFVSREEFAAVKDMAAAAREEVETLKARIADLEARLAGQDAGQGQA
ncbi:accessory factor UbiK family protein [Novosphingobium pokkalii]|uniref:Accessory factor UbiK family protein n=1 Tax=Novosphingobium pokkalii TaxID=1770194 RepID=A0ABV7UYS8_9SPHN|nr:accessory factor UbiK family protein [Novosphingobium pokkalii]GHC99193.1 pyrroline-5-carboxylate reductase [Novosphingobium pokkalii]